MFIVRLTLFNLQGTVRFPPNAVSLLILAQQYKVVNNYFSVFATFLQLCFFATALSDSFDIISKESPLVKHLFHFFTTFFITLYLVL